MPFCYLMTSFSVGFEIGMEGLSFFGLFGSGDLSEKTMLSKLIFLVSFQNS